MPKISFDLDSNVQGEHESAQKEHDNALGIVQERENDLNIVQEHEIDLKTLPEDELENAKTQHENELSNDKERDVPDSSQLKLVRVSIIFRHGASTPKTSLSENDCTSAVGNRFLGACASAQRPYSKRYRTFDVEPASGYTPNLSAYSERSITRRLTKRGQEKLAELGKTIRQRYVKFLPQQFSSDSFRIRSTDYERTIESAASLLYALYPPSEGIEEYIEILVVKCDDENMYPRSGCHQMNVLRRKALEASNEARKNHRAALQQNLPFAIDTFESIHNTIQCHLANGVELPFSVDAELRRRIHDEAAHEMDTKYGCVTVLRLAIGRFLGDVLRDLEAPEQSRTSPLKMLLYSGHDASVGLLFKALMTDARSKDSPVATLSQFPVYASSITLELYERQVDGTFWVRVLYNDEDLRLLDAHSNADGMYLSDFASFLKRLQPLILSRKEYIDECKETPS